MQVIEDQDLEIGMRDPGMTGVETETEEETEKEEETEDTNIEEAVAEVEITLEGKGDDNIIN